MNINNEGIKIIVGVLALVLTIAPLVGFAKENDNKGKGKENSVKTEMKLAIKEEKKEKREDRREDRRENRQEDDDDKNERKNSSCFKAFGHLIAPGFIKNNGGASLGVDCVLPFGIGKKFYGTTTIGTSTNPIVDTVAPIITSVTSSPLQTKATIKWVTDEKSHSVVFYATSSAALDTQSSSTSRVMKSGLVKDHTIELKNLATSTTYYFRVGSKDASGNMVFSNVYSFVTKAPDTVVTYPVVSNIATITGSTTVAIAWKTNESATTKVYYGTTTPNVNASSTSFVVNNDLVKDHAITVTGLATSTQYTFVIESKNAQGNATYSNSFGVTTQAGN